MKYLLPFNIFESISESPYQEKDWDSMTIEEKKSKLFSIYPPIPIEKRKAAYVIRKIRYAERENKSKLGDDTINFPDKRLIDKVRWNEYLTTLSSSKEIRGHNFEGFIAGLYGGEFTEPGDRADLKINGKMVSVKSLDNSSQSVVLGSVFDSLSKERRDRVRSVTNRSIFQVFLERNSDEEDLRREIWEAGFCGVNNVDYFIIAFFNVKDGTIHLHTISNDAMFRFINSPGKKLVSPKRKSEFFQLRISAKYKEIKDQKKIVIKIPQITKEDLDQIWNTTARDWGSKVFGKKISKKMRTDTIEDIIDDKEEISKRMSEN